MLNYAGLRLDLPRRTPAAASGLLARWAAWARRSLAPPRQLARPAAPCTPPAAAVAEAAPPAVAAGLMVGGRWVVQQRLGQGGFGEVWCGHDSASGEAVALKFARVPARIKHLRHEAGIVRRLAGCAHSSHYIDFVDAPGQPCLVLGRGGESLAAYRRRQPERRLPPALALRLALQMLDALQAVHQRGLVHRDVKAANFVFAGPGAASACVLVDFGLARRWRPRRGSAPARAPRGIVGTPRYASLQVHAGQPPAPRDDLWSWFYAVSQLFSGDLPWQTLEDRHAIAAAKHEHLAQAGQLPAPLAALAGVLSGGSFGGSSDERPDEQPDERPDEPVDSGGAGAADTARLRAVLQQALAEMGEC